MMRRRRAARRGRPSHRSRSESVGGLERGRLGDGRISMSSAGVSGRYIASMITMAPSTSRIQSSSAVVADVGSPAELAVIAIMERCSHSVQRAPGQLYGQIESELGGW